MAFGKIGEAYILEVILKLGSNNKVLNLIGFQLSWWAIALYREKAILMVLLLIGIHFYFLRKSQKLGEFKFVICVTFLGFIIDSILLNLNILSVEGSLFLFLELIPIWLIILWVAFACTLNHSLSWLFHSKLWAFFIGGLGGASSYIGAAKLGTINIHIPDWIFFILLFCIWSTFFCVISLFKKKSIKGRRTGRVSVLQD